MPTEHALIRLHMQSDQDMLCLLLYLEFCSFGRSVFYKGEGGGDGYYSWGIYTDQYGNMFSKT